MKLKLFGTVTAALALFTLTGCGGTQPTPQQTPQAKTQTQTKKDSRFVIGKTTKADVIQMLGNPNGDSYNSKGEEMITYIHRHRTGKAWIPFYFGSDRVRTKVQRFTFKNDILVALSTNTNHY
jgi:predicted small lipoprotein YifL